MAKEQFRETLRSVFTFAQRAALLYLLATTLTESTSSTTPDRILTSACSAYDMPTENPTVTLDAIDADIKTELFIVNCSEGFVVVSTQGSLNTSRGELHKQFPLPENAVLHSVGSNTFLLNFTLNQCVYNYIINLNEKKAYYLSSGLCPDPSQPSPSQSGDLFA